MGGNRTCAERMCSSEKELLAVESCSKLAGLIYCLFWLRMCLRFALATALSGKIVAFSSRPRHYFGICTISLVLYTKMLREFWCNESSILRRHRVFSCAFAQSIRYRNSFSDILDASFKLRVLVRFFLSTFDFLFLADRYYA